MTSEKDVLSKLHAIDLSLSPDFPFFIGTYQTKYRRGTKAAEKNLIPLLNQALSILKNDDIIQDKDKLVQELSASIELIDAVDFSDPRFIAKHKFKYIKIIKRLIRPDRPYSYSDFKAGFQKKHHKLDNHFRFFGIQGYKETYILSAWEAVKYEFVLPENPNIALYKEIYDKVYPIGKVSSPISKLYFCFNHEVELVYSNPTPIFQKGMYRFDQYNRTLHPTSLIRYRYVLFPEGALEDCDEIKLFTGVKFGPRMGQGSIVQYTRSGKNQYKESDRIRHWVS